MNWRCALRPTPPMPVKFLTLAGGFCIPISQGRRPRPGASIGDQIVHQSRPGRSARDLASLVVSAMDALQRERTQRRCLSRVDPERFPRQIFLVTDGASSLSTGNFSRVIRRTIRWPSATALEIRPPAELVSVVGPCTRPRSPWPTGWRCPWPRSGDLVVVYQSGAYGASASPGLPRAIRRCAKSCLKRLSGLFVRSVKYTVIVSSICGRGLECLRDKEGVLAGVSAASCCASDLGVKHVPEVMADQ